MKQGFINFHITNFLYFTQNFPLDWLSSVWEDDPDIKEHLKEKFYQCYQKYGASASVVRFFFELDEKNKEKLLTWVGANYKYNS